MVRYKINSNKLEAFLCTKDKQAEKEFRETTPFTIFKNNMKYPGVPHPNTQMICKKITSRALENEIDNDLRKWRDRSSSWIGRINTVKMSILPKAIYRYPARKNGYKKNVV